MSLKYSTNKVTTDYAKVTSDDDFELQATAVAATDLNAPFHHFQVHENFRHIPEARNLTWTDDFFELEDADDIVAVFDLDYEAMESFYSNVGWVCIGLSLLYTPLFVIASLTLAPCFLRKNVKWTVRAKHVAITRDGIRFVEDRRACGWGAYAWMSARVPRRVRCFNRLKDDLWCAINGCISHCYTFLIHSAFR